VVIKRGKKPVAAVISLEDLKLLEQLEDARDAELLKEGLAEPGERVEAEEFFRRQRIRVSIARSREQ
jgi:PHD/YefM family antitoxin component YafN of YafNO toxin-antitoxin module